MIILEWQKCDNKCPKIQGDSKSRVIWYTFTKHWELDKSTDCVSVEAFNMREK